MQLHKLLQNDRGLVIMHRERKDMKALPGALLGQLMQIGPLAAYSQVEESINVALTNASQYRLVIFRCFLMLCYGVY